jgi:hypothetical protein
VTKIPTKWDKSFGNNENILHSTICTVLQIERTMRLMTTMMTTVAAMTTIKQRSKPNWNSWVKVFMI